LWQWDAALIRRRTDGGGQTAHGGDARKTRNHVGHHYAAPQPGPKSKPVVSGLFCQIPWVSVIEEEKGTHDSNQEGAPRQWGGRIRSRSLRPVERHRVAQQPVALAYALQLEIGVEHLRRLAVVGEQVVVAGNHRLHVEPPG